MQVSNVSKLPGTYEAEVEKPLGITLKPKPGSGGGVVIVSRSSHLWDYMSSLLAVLMFVRFYNVLLQSGVAPFSNGAKAGLKSGDQVIYTSSFFGDELWPADNEGFTRSAVQVPQLRSNSFKVISFRTFNP